jgi:LEA14-like dessication related protein
LSSGGENSALVLLILVVLVASAVEAFGYYSSHLPSTQEKSLVEGIQLRSTSVNVMGLSSNGLSLDLNAVVYNPNAFGAKLDAVNYSIYADGHYLGNGQTVHEYYIAPQSSQTLVFPVNIGWTSAFQTMGSYILSGDNVTWMVNGTANVEVGGLALSVPFKFTTG